MSSGAAVDVKGATKPGDSAIISTVASSDDSVVLAAPEPSAAAMAHFRVLLQVSTALSAVFDVDQILNKVMDIVFEQLRADRGFIGLVEDGDAARVNPRVVRYRDEDQVGKIAVSQTIIQHVISRKEGVLSSDAMTDQRFSKGKSVHNLSIRSAICVPIPGRDRILGVIDIDSLVANFSYTTDQLRLLHGDRAAHGDGDREHAAVPGKRAARAAGGGGGDGGVAVAFDQEHSAGDARRGGRGGGGAARRTAVEDAKHGLEDAGAEPGQGRRR